jgi:adenylate cyclase
MGYSGKRKELNSLIGTILFWFIVILAYDIFRRLGIEEMPGILVTNPISRQENFIFTAIMSVITGILYYTFDRILDHPKLKRKSIGFQFVLEFGSFALLITIVLNLGLYFLNLLFDNQFVYPANGMLRSGAVWSFIIYFTLCSAIFSLLKLVNEKFGHGVLWDMMTGKYMKPRVEKKIFMFLDLRSSTNLAENLGYRKYSSLIQECFYDLNDVVAKTSAEIYQYVGDEVVLIWDFEKGIKQHECIDLYFLFRNRINERRDHYLNTYGVVPEFKAGLHGGNLMVAEVGVVKKDIAYHGDVINTTARIQSMCNELKSSFLISNHLLEALSEKGSYSFEFKGDFVLKGKETQTGLHSINKLDTQ